MFLQVKQLVRYFSIFDENIAFMSNNEKYLQRFRNIWKMILGLALRVVA